MKSKFKRAACLGLTAAMCATFIAGQAFAYTDKDKSLAQQPKEYNLSFENVNGKVDLTEVKVNNFSSQVVQNNSMTKELSETTGTVIVTLKGKPLADSGLGDAAAKRSLENEQKAFLSELNKAGISYTLRSSYNTILNGVAIDVKFSSLSAIKAMDGVSTVTVGSTYERPKAIAVSDGAQTNYSSIYKTGIYDSQEYLDKANGSGMAVAILDTGLDYTHEAFASVFEEDTEFRYSYDNVTELMDDIDFRASKSGATADDVYVSAKVPFAYDYADRDADVYPSYSQHGTHVAGIVAGKADRYTDKDGNTPTYIDDDGNEVDIPFRGVAPEAQLVICKVFTDNLEDSSIGGAEAVDIIDALEDCYNLNVDVINMSLGTSCGFSSASLGLTPEDEEGALMKDIYQRIRDKGISLIVAASNEFSAGYGSAYGTNLASNPDSGTVGSPSTFTGSVSVASVNGQMSSYMLANATVNGDTVSGGTAIYYEESRNEDSDAYNFIGDLLGCDKVGCKDSYHESNGLHNPENIKQSATFKYVVVPGSGEAGDYTSRIKSEFNNKKEGEKIIAVVKRGGKTFKDKIETARANGADAVIVYNNVSGLIRMSLGDMSAHIPAISISMEAGLALTGTGSSRRTTGTITLDRSYLAGPFMNDYSSWGTTPDLQLKPDVTSHGGEITSTVAGGYEEMSGTSMACPNLAGFTTLLRSYIKNNYTDLWEDNVDLTLLTNKILMSTATTVYDQNELPYSPRKQGAGLATLKNVFSTKAYLYTKEEDGMCADERPKAELGDDPAKKGEYSMTFYVKNFGDTQLSFTTNAIFMTETLGADGKSVAEKARILGEKTADGNYRTNATWTVDGTSVAEGGTFTVDAGKEAKIQCTLRLTAAEKKEIETNFKNGMFVEGFLQLLGSGEQCTLNFPFMGFYGDWTAAPMMDLTAFEVAADAKDTSKKDEERRQPAVWATQAYAYYWEDRYTIPMGSFLYIQDEAKEHTADYVYPEEEHIAISRFYEYYGDNNGNNYITTEGIKALYAGLLRNAEIVTYTLTNVDTGEVIPDNNGKAVREVYRVGKSYAGGGSSTPSQVLLELKTNEMGLSANGKYRLDFNFYFDYDDYKDGKATENTYSMNFYIDYEAPVLVDSRIRFQDKKDENNKDIQTVYLDLDIYDNHYPQAVMLCYSESADEAEMQSVKLATEYVTPIINPKKNAINTVSIDITDIYAEYRGKFFVEIDDYALNNNVYRIDPNYSENSVCPTDFTIAQGSAITIEKNTATKLTLENIGDANLSNFIWRTTRRNVVRVEKGEIFGVAEGTSTITVSGGSGRSQSITVTVVDSGKSLPNPKISFGTMLNSSDNPVLAKGTVAVNPAQQFKLEVKPDPWYYPIETMEFVWTSSDPDAVKVEQDGTVTVLYEEDVRTTKQVTVTAAAKDNPNLKTSVVLAIENPYTVSNGVLTRYKGWGGKLNSDGVRVLEIPNDKSITNIGEDAFKENENVQIVIIPKNVTTISERAFIDCKNLKKICFISEDKIVPADSSLTMISRTAFSGCTGLETLDLSNCKVITIDRNVFTNCTSLKEIKQMQSIGTAYPQTFAGCTSLENIDISELHVAGSNLFAGCTGLKNITTGKNTTLSQNMFNGCTALESVTIKCANIPNGAFANCSNLKSVTFEVDGDISVGAQAFLNCSNLATVQVVGSSQLKTIGTRAFANCTRLQNATSLIGANTVLGQNAFEHVTSANAEVIEGSKLIKAASTVTSSALAEDVTQIGAYAFGNSQLSGVNTIDISGVTSLGAGAFYGLVGLTEITLPEGITEIPAYAFYGTSITQITIPASVTKIGASAFANCSSLAAVTFAEGSALTEIGASAFTRTAIAQISIPDGVATIGSSAFARCAQLTAAEISSVKTMGSEVFAFCPKLATVTFGAGATTTGTNTFNTKLYTVNSNGETVLLEGVESSLTTVELSGTIERIGEGTFANCNRLASIDLKNAVIIEDNGFYACSALRTVTGLENVTHIGSAAFAGCSSLINLNLSAVQSLYYRAFFGATGLRTVTFGDKLDGIGDEAFAETSVTAVTIPASVTYVGTSAFSGVTGLRAFEVEENSENYFAEEGVLYRYIDKVNGVYELISYPLGKIAPAVENVSTYTVKEGTVNIHAFAFYGVTPNSVTKVILPQSLKTVGNGAFFNCGITVFQFDSVAAPVLLEDISVRVIPTT
ncbi:MAG: leucine-rich repeat protein, partial [Clostridia bacterium]|nr:leucine-rich repeat protein [Clostridia bacterium]